MPSKPDHLQARLEHVGIRRYLAERTIDGQPPAWAAENKFEEGNGAVILQGHGDDLVAASLSVNLRAAGGVFVSITVDGVYAIGPDSVGLSPDHEGNNSMLSRIPPHLQNGLARQASIDLYPFLRQAVHEASSTVLPVKPGILLAPGGVEFTQEMKHISGIERVTAAE